MYSLSPDKRYVYIDGRPVSVDLIYNWDKMATSAVDSTEVACGRMLEGKPWKLGLSNSSSYHKKLNTILKALE